MLEICRVIGMYFPSDVGKNDTETRAHVTLNDDKYKSGTVNGLETML